jgi:hypothetical protein
MRQCKYCDTTFQPKHKNIYCSGKCYHNSTRGKIGKRKIANRPTKDQIKELLLQHSFVKVGKMYGVSDNAVRKWLR